MLLLLVLSLVFGTDFFALLGVNPSSPASPSAPTRPQTSAAEEELVEFMNFLIDDTQETWVQIFRENDLQYQPAVLVLYRDAVDSGCGFAPASAGPFYCPRDQKVYIDLSFYDTLRTRYGAPGDFAQAYVIAHEIGHHVQTLLGTAEVRQLQQQNPAEASQLSVAMELQADCYAGVWGADAAANDLLERGDFEEGLTAAAAVGDDRLLRQAGRSPNPETFTHGSSEQRMRWFRRGFESGDPSACETFTSLP